MRIKTFTPRPDNTKAEGYYVGHFGQVFRTTPDGLNQVEMINGGTGVFATDELDEIKYSEETYQALVDSVGDERQASPNVVEYDAWSQTPAMGTQGQGRVSQVDRRKCDGQGWGSRRLCQGIGLREEQGLSKER